MKAIFEFDGEQGPSNGRNLSDKKETIGGYRLVAAKSGVAGADRFSQPVWVVFYQGRSSNASVVYCTIWVHGSGRYCAGHGQAGGWGYHKPSAAFQEALNSAGISLVDDNAARLHIDGAGDSKVEEAIRAIGVALGYSLDDLHVVKY